MDWTAAPHLNLDDHMLSIVQHSRVHLANGGSSQGLGVKVLHLLPPIFTQLFLQYFLEGGREREGRREREREGGKMEQRSGERKGEGRRKERGPHGEVDTRERRLSTQPMTTVSLASYPGSSLSLQVQRSSIIACAQGEP